MTLEQKRAELERVREWKRVGLALAMGCAAYETLILAENPELALERDVIPDRL